MLNKKLLFLTFKISLIIIVIFYLFNHVNISFINNVYQYYYIIFLIIPIFIIKLYLNSIKISYLLKILDKKKINIKSIFTVLIKSQITVAIPGSFLVGKAWVDTFLIKENKLGFYDYIKFNIYSILGPIIIFLFIHAMTINKITLLVSVIILLSLSLFIKKYLNYYLYIFFSALNILSNIFISFFIIYFINPEILEIHFIDIFLSSMISIYLDSLSVLPLNIGYGQMIYSLSFKYFSLPSDLALTIITIKQISYVILIIPILFFFILNNKNNKDKFDK